MAAEAVGPAGRAGLFSRTANALVPAPTNSSPVAGKRVHRPVSASVGRRATGGNGRVAERDRELQDGWLSRGVRVRRRSARPATERRRIADHLAGCRTIEARTSPEEALAASNAPPATGRRRHRLRRWRPGERNARRAETDEPAVRTAAVVLGEMCRTSNHAASRRRSTTSVEACLDARAARPPRAMGLFTTPVAWHEPARQNIIHCCPAIFALG